MMSVAAISGQTYLFQLVQGLRCLVPSQLQPPLYLLNTLHRPPHLCKAGLHSRLFICIGSMHGLQCQLGIFLVLAFAIAPKVTRSLWTFKERPVTQEVFWVGQSEAGGSQILHPASPPPLLL